MSLLISSFLLIPTSDTVFPVTALLSLAGSRLTISFLNLSDSLLFHNHLGTSYSLLFQD